MIEKTIDNFTFVCNTYTTRNAWGHIGKLYYKDCLVATEKIRYYNRTWERYEYQTIMQSLLHIYEQDIINEFKRQFKQSHKYTRLTETRLAEFNKILQRNDRIKEIEKVKGVL